MGPKIKILNYAKQKDFFKSKDLAPILKVSRQTIALHLTYLVNNGNLVREGSTRNAIYRLRKTGEAISGRSHAKMIKKLKALEEDQVQEGYEFNKNEMQVRLSSNHEFMSRSQARRTPMGQNITFLTQWSDHPLNGLRRNLLRIQVNRPGFA